MDVMEEYLDKIVLIRFKRKFKIYELEAYVHDIKNRNLYLIYEDSNSFTLKFEIIKFSSILEISIIRITNNSLEPGFYNISAVHDYVELEKRLGYKMSAIDKELMYQYEKQLRESVCNFLDIPTSTLKKL